MRNLRLVFDVKGKRKDITLPMEDWIDDYWFTCENIPQSDAVILLAELDGENILEDIMPEKEVKTFNDIINYFEWDVLDETSFANLQRRMERDNI